MTSEPSLEQASDINAIPKSKLYVSMGLALGAVMLPFILALFANQHDQDAYMIILKTATLYAAPLLIIATGRIRFLRLVRRFIFSLSLILLIWSALSSFHIWYANFMRIPEMEQPEAPAPAPAKLLTAQEMVNVLKTVRGLMSDQVTQFQDASTQIDQIDLESILSPYNAANSNTLAQSKALVQQYARLLAKRDQIVAEGAKKTSDAYTAFVNNSPFSADERKLHLADFAKSGQEISALYQTLDGIQKDILQNLQGTVKFYETNSSKIVVTSTATVFQSQEESDQLNLLTKNIHDQVERENKYESGIVFHQRKRIKALDLLISGLNKISETPPQ